MRISKGLFVAGFCAIAALIPAASHAQTKIIVGYTATMDTAPMFIAIEKGYFQKRGLDVTPQLMTVNSIIPPAIVSDSIQIGMPTATTFLQAVDNGLDLVVVSGLNFTRKTDVNFGIVVRTGANITKAQDFVGKKIGVPGLNAFLHVMFREWLRANGVDAKQVQFVETPFPQMNEIMKSGNIDGAITAEPFQGRIIKSGTGTMLSYFTKDLQEGLPIVFLASSRKWVSANPAAATAFREAMAEGMKQVQANVDEARAITSKNLKIPLEIVAGIEFSPFNTVVAPEGLTSWVGLMKQQAMINTAPDAAKLIVK